MRFYGFGNMYLSSIQQGIQAAHVTAELFTKYIPYLDMAIEEITPETQMLTDWAEDHKTMILLNGGYGCVMHELFDFFETDDNPYPFAKFHEGKDALDGALTCVGIVLPEKIYQTASDVRHNTSTIALATLAGKGFTPWEMELITRLNKFSLAR